MFTRLDLFGFLWGAGPPVPGKGCRGQCPSCEIIGRDQMGRAGEIPVVPTLDEGRHGGSAVRGRRGPKSAALALCQRIPLLWN